MTHGLHDMLEVNARRAPSDNYTWFPQQLRNARKHRHGRRLDYVLWDGDPLDVVARTRQEIPGSDHCPLEVVLVWGS